MSALGGPLEVENEPPAVAVVMWLHNELNAHALALHFADFPKEQHVERLRDLFNTAVIELFGDYYSVKIVQFNEGNFHEK